MPERDYIYYDFTVSLCPVCLRRIDAKIVFQDGKVYIAEELSAARISQGADRNGYQLL